MSGARGCNLTNINLFCRIKLSTLYTNVMELHVKRATVDSLLSWYLLKDSCGKYRVQHRKHKHLNQQSINIFSSTTFSQLLVRHLNLQINSSKDSGVIVYFCSSFLVSLVPRDLVSHFPFRVRTNQSVLWEFYWKRLVSDLSIHCFPSKKES